ncbi:MAG: hypothetical protein JSU63_02660 [Phycisphaerales bacterium]|nr:MAG: hypothetical protein JSU63_02660 [Phycisphaerales bacterium]
MMKRTAIHTICIALTASLAGVLSTAHALEEYEGYYFYIGDYPYDANPGWHEDVQGVTHDDDYWFITQSVEDDPGRQAIWKIPVGFALASAAVPGINGVRRVLMIDYPALVAQGYWHFGDPSYYRFEGQGYLIVPVEFECWGIAIFNADTLALIGSAPLCTYQTGGVPWCAVDPRNGLLYSSGYSAAVWMNEYQVNWSELHQGQALELNHMRRVYWGDLNLILSHVQGGVFSPSGELLYIVADGIHVFETETWRRIKQSTNGSGVFNYEFSPGFSEYEEPEGLTIWDLEDGRAPDVWGELHVLLLDNDVSADEIYFKHYRRSIFVDAANTGLQTGDPAHPFRTVVMAHYFAWDGARISIKAGHYPETLTLDKRVQLVARGGTAVIGE